MGFCNKFRAEITIKEYFESKEEIEDRINALVSLIDEYEKKLLMHSVSGVASAMKSDDNRKPLDAVEYIYEVTSDLIEKNNEANLELFKLRLLYKNWED